MNDEYIDYETLKDLFIDAVEHAREANRLVFEGSDRAEFAAVGEMACAYSDARSMWLYTKLNLNAAHSEFDQFMTRMSIYQHELSSNVSSNHSHQWSNIEFGSVIKAANEIAGLLSVGDIFTEEEVTDFLS